MRASDLVIDVKNILKFENKASLPSIGKTGVLYHNKEKNVYYKWSETGYKLLDSESDAKVKTMLEDIANIKNQSKVLHVGDEPPVEKTLLWVDTDNLKM